jgi:hypothetical protein
MKIFLPIPFLSAVFGLSALVHAQSAALFTVRIHQDSQLAIAKDRFTFTQKRSLQVFVTNSSGEEAAVKIKYTYFGHPMDGHELSAVDQGEVDATVKSGVTQEVDMPTSSQVYAPEHFDTKVKKRVAGTGNKVTGYGVQVLLGDKVVAESYEPPSMKEEMSKAPPVKKVTPTPAPKK